MKWKSADHFCSRLQKRGYVYLGSGCYSEVWAKPNSKRVIKVCRRVDPWAEYALWATQRGYAGKLAPLVYSFRLLTTQKNEVFYVAVVERLPQTVWQHDGDRLDAPMTNRAKLLSRAIHNDYEVPECTVEEREFVREFRAAFHRNYRCSFDLHMSNWMVVDGRLVLNDPLSGEGQSPSNRWRRDRVPNVRVPVLLAA